MIRLESEDYMPGSRPWIEAQMGEVAALLISTIFERLKEHHQRLPQSEVSKMGAQLLECLVSWKTDPKVPMDLDFDEVVRNHAPGALRRLYPTWNYNPAVADQMIDDVLRMVSNVAKSAAN
jgi:hypothetical protein